MKIIENWANVSGKIIDIKPDPTLRDFDNIKVKISGIKDHLAYPNLLTSGNDTMDIKLPRSTSSTLGLAADKKVSALVRAAGGQNYFFDENSIRVD